MNLSADQIAIRDAAEGFLAANASFDHVRRALAEPEGWSRDLWSRFGVELGFAGLAVPTVQGGSGLGLAELALVAEELGACLAPMPWFEIAVLSALTLQAAGATVQQSDIAAGRVVTLAMRDELGRPLPLGTGPEIRNGALEGEAHFVPFGHVAEQLIVAAREHGGISLFAIAADAPGVEIIPKVTLDPTRPMASIRFARVEVGSARLGAAGQSEEALMRALGLSAAVLAAEQVGGMRRTLKDTPGREPGPNTFNWSSGPKSRKSKSRNTDTTWDLACKPHRPTPAELRVPSVSRCHGVGKSGESECRSSGS